MKIFYPLLLCFAFYFQVSFAQELSVDPYPLEETFIVDLSDEFVEVSTSVIATNLTDDLYALRWEIVQESGPEEWLFQVSDDNISYLPGVTTNYDYVTGMPQQPVLLEPDGEAYLGVNVRPQGVGGTSVYKMYFTNIEAMAPSLDSAIYIIHINPTTAATDLDNSESVEVHPNPFSKTTTINCSKTPQTAVLRNLQGQVIREIPTPGATFDLSAENLQNGLYLLQLDFENGQTLTQKIVLAR